MQQDQIITGIVKTRRGYNRHPAKPQTGLLDGVELRLIAGRRMGKNDAYPGEWVLVGADDKAKMILRITGTMWLAQRDVEVGE